MCISGLTANVDGVPAAAVNASDTWGEFGARLGARLTDHLSASLDAGGTAGGGAIGTTLHRGASVAYSS